MSRSFRPTPALVVSVLALIVAVGGGSFAIARSTAGHEKKVVTRIVRKLAPHLSVSHAATAGSAQRADSAGNADNLGGQPAASYEPRSQWALVNKGGQILAQSGGITIDATRASFGQYVLDFGSSVAARPVSAVAHYPDGGLSGEPSVAPCGNTAVTGGAECSFVSPLDETPEHLFVEMHDPNGGDAPFGFYVTVGH